MIDKVSVERCVLCKACSDACPTKAIQFTKEYCGFQYPQINSGKCIGCNRCETVCPTLNLPPKTPPMITFEAKNKNEKIQEEPSSIEEQKTDNENQIDENEKEIVKSEKQ